MHNLRISKKLFMETSGLFDSRNKKTDVEEAISGWLGPDGCIFYQAACTLVSQLYKDGKFWMWEPESFPKRLLDHIDDWIAAGLISFDYR